MLLVSQTKHYVYGQSWIWFDCQNSYNRAFAAGGKVPQGQRFPTWGTCTPGDTFAYPKGYICLSKEYICLSEGIQLRLATEVKYIFTYLLFPNIYTFIHVSVNIILKIRYMPIVKYICA